MTVTLHGTLVVLLLLAAAILFGVATFLSVGAGRLIPAGLCLVAIALMLEGGGL